VVERVVHPLHRRGEREIEQILIRILSGLIPMRFRLIEDLNGERLRAGLGASWRIDRRRNRRRRGDRRPGIEHGMVASKDRPVAESRTGLVEGSDLFPVLAKEWQDDIDATHDLLETRRVLVGLPPEAGKIVSRDEDILGLHLETSIAVSRQETRIAIHDGVEGLWLKEVAVELVKDHARLTRVSIAIEARAFGTGYNIDSAQHVGKCVGCPSLACVRRTNEKKHHRFKVAGFLSETEIGREASFIPNKLTEGLLSNSIEITGLIENTFDTFKVASLPLGLASAPRPRSARKRRRVVLEGIVGSSISAIVHLSSATLEAGDGVNVGRATLEVELNVSLNVVVTSGANF